MKKIFIVDDSYFMREMLKTILSKENYIIAGEAADGYEAIEKLQTVETDLVTLDIAMEHMDGLQTLERLIEYSPEMKIVMCSAMGQKPIVKDALEKGARDFIVKPFTSSKVLETIKKVIEN